MDIKEFYEKYRLSKDTFAPIAGVGKNSLIKFEEGKQLRADTRARIELAMKVAEKHNLVRPQYDHAKAFNCAGSSYSISFYYECLKYQELFKGLIRREKERS